MMSTKKKMMMSTKTKVNLKQAKGESFACLQKLVLRPDLYKFYNVRYNLKDNKC